MDGVAIASLAVSILGVLLAVEALRRAVGARKAAERALRTASRQRLVTALTRLEFAVGTLQRVLREGPAALFLSVSQDWRLIQAEVRGLVGLVDPPGKEQMLTELVGTATMVAIARERTVGETDFELPSGTAELSRRLDSLMDLVVENRIALEQGSEAP